MYGNLLLKKIIEVHLQIEIENLEYIIFSIILNVIFDKELK